MCAAVQALPHTRPRWQEVRRGPLLRFPALSPCSIPTVTFEHIGGTTGTWALELPSSQSAVQDID
jgi:hypothetical protein